MKKVELNVFAKNVKGEDLPGLYIGQIASEEICNGAAPKGTALKLWSIAQRLYKNEPIELDISDLQVLKDFIDASTTMTVMAKGQILEILNNATDV